MYVHYGACAPHCVCESSVFEFVSVGLRFHQDPAAATKAAEARAAAEAEARQARTRVR